MIHINKVELIAGELEVLDRPLQTYSVEIVTFLDDLSKVLLKSKEIRTYPDLSAFAFWCRKANIEKIRLKYKDLDKRLGRGICFHIAPSNIPINFAFSYVFSLLAGNANIVRIPSKLYPQVEYLCKIINEVLQNYEEIFKRTAFIKYSRENLEISKYFSSISDCRMIWGGDATVKNFKSFDTKPNCIDISFSDKYSICIIDGKLILDTNDKGMKKLANDFYNDTYLMDQNACSSPQMIYWINDSKSAREKFWQGVFAVAKDKYKLEDSVVMDKFTKLCMNSIDLDNISSISNITNLIYNIEFSSINQRMEELRGRSGYFFEYSLNSYDEIFRIVNEKYQTVTHFGIDVEKFTKELINSYVKGISRIVPIGKALEIDIIWDGYDILRELSRNITVY